MKSITIKKQQYIIQENGVLVPSDLVKETGNKIKTSEDVNIHCQDLKFEEQECFVVLTLDGSSQVISKHQVTKGPRNCNTKALYIN